MRVFYVKSIHDLGIASRHFRFWALGPNKLMKIKNASIAIQTKSPELFCCLAYWVLIKRQKTAWETFMFLPCDANALLFGSQQNKPHETIFAISINKNVLYKNNFTKMCDKCVFLSFIKPHNILNATTWGGFVNFQCNLQYQFQISS